MTPGEITKSKVSNKRWRRSFIWGPLRWNASRFNLGKIRILNNSISAFSLEGRIVSPHSAEIPPTCVTMLVFFRLCSPDSNRDQRGAASVSLPRDFTLWNGVISDLAEAAAAVHSGFCYQPIATPSRTTCDTLVSLCVSQLAALLPPLPRCEANKLTGGKRASCLPHFWQQRKGPFGLNGTVASLFCSRLFLHSVCMGLLAMMH